MKIIGIISGLAFGLFIGAFLGDRAINFATDKAASRSDGWNVNYDLGNYGNRFMLRAVVARIGLGALPKEEALYFNANVDGDGEQLNGRDKYEIHFPANALPDVNAFWSLTPYHKSTELLVENPIDRYQIGDRSTHLRYGPNGDLTLYIQHEEPNDPDKIANWLPTPIGEFSITFRAYEPGARMLSGEYVPPLLARMEGDQ